MTTIASTCAAIAAERQAQVEAETRRDADAWCGATETLDSLLDDLCALLRQRDGVSHGLAPVL